MLITINSILLQTWWRNQMEAFSALLAFVWGIHRSPVNSRTKASHAELWSFLWSSPEPTVEQTMYTLVIWDATAFIMTSLQWLKSRDLWVWSLFDEMWMAWYFIWNISFWNHHYNSEYYTIVTVVHGHWAVMVINMTHTRTYSKWNRDASEDLTDWCTKITITKTMYTNIVS